MPCPVLTVVWKRLGTGATASLGVHESGGEHERPVATCPPQWPLVLARSVQRCPPKREVVGLQSSWYPKPPHLSELLPRIGPGPEVGLVLAEGDRHQRVAAVIEYRPVAEGGKGQEKLVTETTTLGSH